MSSPPSSSGDRYDFGRLVTKVRVRNTTASGSLTRADHAGPEKIRATYFARWSASQLDDNGESNDRRTNKPLRPRARNRVSSRASRMMRQGSRSKPDRRDAPAGERCVPGVLGKKFLNRVRASRTRGGGCV